MLLTVAIEAISVRGASLRFEYLVTAGDETIAEGFTVHACVDSSGKVVRLPPDVRALFEKGVG